MDDLFVCPLRVKLARRLNWRPGTSLGPTYLWGAIFSKKIQKKGEGLEPQTGRAKGHRMWEAWRVEALRCIERPEIGIYRHQYALRGIERRVIDMHKGGWSRKREGTHPF